MKVDYLDAEDVMKLMKVSRGSAYKAIAACNEELEEQGYRTIRGRCPGHYLRKRYHLEEMRECKETEN